MKKIIKVLIVLFIFYLLYSYLSSFLFIKKNNDKNNDEYNKKYNKKYNMNYNDNRVYNTDDLNRMLSTTATVIDIPTTQEIEINNKKITVYYTNIEYDIINYYEKVIGKINAMGNIEDITKNKIILNKKQNLKFDDPIKINSGIITTKQIQKGDKFTVYYNYDIDRTAPPFLPEKYVS
jgi:hypothetical protein